MARPDSRWSVSVVVPTRDRGRLLDMTVRTILAQRDVELEVLVVDDGSTPPLEATGTLADARVRLLRHGVSRGVAAARNTGLAAARTPWVAFTDDDDLWAPEKLVAQIAALQATPGAGWSCVGAIQFDAELRAISAQMGPSSGDVAGAVLLRNCIPGGGSGVLASTALVRHLGGFDERLSNSADYDMWLRLALAAPIATVRRPLLAYRVHASGMSRQLDDIYREVGLVRAKHEHARAARHIPVDGMIDLWIADRHQRSGRRLPAAKAFLRAWRSLGVRALSRAGEALLWPDAYRWRDLRRGRAIRPDQRAEFEAWFDPIRLELAPEPPAPATALQGAAGRGHGGHDGVPRRRTSHRGAAPAAGGTRTRAAG